MKGKNMHFAHRIKGQIFAILEEKGTATIVRNAKTISRHRPPRTSFSVPYRVCDPWGLQIPEARPL